MYIANKTMLTDHPANSQWECSNSSHSSLYLDLTPILVTNVSKCVEGRINNQILGVKRLKATF